MYYKQSKSSVMIILTHRLLVKRVDAQLLWNNRDAFIEENIYLNFTRFNFMPAFLKLKLKIFKWMMLFVIHFKILGNILKYILVIGASRNIWYKYYVIREFYS